LAALENCGAFANAEEADRDEYALDALNVTAGDTMREALAVQCWLDADAMRAHAVDFRWRCELAPIGTAGVSAEVLLVVRVDVHGVARELKRWQAREAVKAGR
jgi:hypothetical protein